MTVNTLYVPTYTSVAGSFVYKESPKIHTYVHACIKTVNDKAFCNYFYSNWEVEILNHLQSQNFEAF